MTHWSFSAYGRIKLNILYLVYAVHYFPACWLPTWATKRKRILSHLNGNSFCLNYISLRTKTVKKKWPRCTKVWRVVRHKSKPLFTRHFFIVLEEPCDALNLQGQANQHMHSRMKHASTDHCMLSQHSMVWLCWAESRWRQQGVAKKKTPHCSHRSHSPG